MCRKATARASSHQWDGYSVSNTNSIGALFRAHGEAYIQSYQPPKRVIRFIRSVRLCRTPGLGWTTYTCTQCGERHTIYKSCGNTQCPVCQSIKREQWMDKLHGKLLQVPYVHAVFTLPHQLNGLARMNKSLIYGLMMQASWRSIQKIYWTWKTTPGMTSVLHTFGSDMKYHIHVHGLVTFGGLDDKGAWVYPDKKNKIASYRSMCSSFKTNFLSLLSKAIELKQVKYHGALDTLINETRKIRWVVHTTHPTAQTENLRTYLGRYINRIAISNNRLKYLESTDEVALLYNDYKQQQTGCAAPKAIRHLTPLNAIDQIVQHVLPRHFQKSRHYGLHHASNKKKEQANQAIQATGKTVRTALEIITQLLKRAVLTCVKCGGDKFEYKEFGPDTVYVKAYLHWKTERAPPTTWGTAKQGTIRSPNARHEHALI